MTIARFQEFFNGYVHGNNPGSAVIKTRGDFSREAPEIFGAFFPALCAINSSDEFTPTDDLPYKPFQRIDRNIVDQTILQRAIQNLRGSKHTDVEHRRKQTVVQQRFFKHNGIFIIAELGHAVFKKLLQPLLACFIPNRVGNGIAEAADIVRKVLKGVGTSLLRKVVYGRKFNLYNRFSFWVFLSVFAVKSPLSTGWLARFIE